jgi:hypothetical protein
MDSFFRLTGITALAMIGAVAIAPSATAQDLTESIAEAAGIPSVAAFLPDRYAVAKTEALPIDGVWLINSIRKKIQIEQGRAFAIDPWLHLMVLKVQPNMVVMENFRRTDAGLYMADDLPLLGPATMRLNREGNLDVSVAGKLGPVKYTLIKLEPQYPAAIQAEVTAATGYTPPPAAPMPVAPAAAPLPGMPGSNQAPPVNPTAPVAAPAAALPGMPGSSGAPSPAVQPPAYSEPEDCVPLNVDEYGNVICR